MSEKNRPNPPGSHALDFSSGKKGAIRRNRSKSFAPVVQQTINLSTPKPEKLDGRDGSPSRPPPNQGAIDTSESPGKMKASPTNNNRPPRSQGNSLADLLDPETLAKLKGEG